MPRPTAASRNRRRRSPARPIFGGTTQFVVAWLIKVTGDPMVPAWYQIVTTVASIVGILLLTPHAEVLRERAVRAEAVP